MKNLRVVLSLLFLWLSWHANADYEVITHEIGDDQWIQVNLPFDFPFYGEVFGTSFMFTNGVVGFINPTTIPGTGYVWDGLCCNAYDFTQSNNNYGTHGDVRFNYLIAPWHTDLIDHPNSDGVMMTQGGCETVDSCYQSYFWENVSEYYDNTDLNTFSTTIEPLGSILFNYTKVDIQSHSVSVFISGDFTNSDEYEQWYYNHPSNGGVYWNSADTEPIEIPETMSICEVSPDASLACLYRPSTWASAYYDQQCGISALYDSGCTGYETAYYNQQCGLDALYDPTCTGYETAYFDNQCELDPLYSPACTGWYYVEEEETENEEYGVPEETIEDFEVFEPETPYFESTEFDISLDFDLTDTFASVNMPELEEYDVSFEDIMIEFEQEIEEQMETFFAEMDIEMPEMEMPDLEDMPEPEFEEFPEMPEPMEEVLDEPIEEPIEETVEEPETETEPIEEETNEEEVLNEESVESEEEETEESERSSDEEIDETVEEEEEIDEEESEEQETEETEEEAEEEREEVEPEPEDTEEVMVAKVEPKKMTAKEKQKAREKKMREIITDKLKNLAVEMGDASSLEAQKQLQNIILALLNYNQGFSSYNLSLNDGDFYESRVIYNIRLPDSLRGRRIGLASELLHKKMVDMQWEEGYGRKTN